MHLSGKWAALAAAGLALSAGGARAQGQKAYFYCSSNYNGVTYYSSVFRIDSGTYSVGIQNAFDGYVAARFNPDASSGAICQGPFDGYQEAANDENDNIGEDRRHGQNVVLTHWAYHGD